MFIEEMGLVFTEKFSEVCSGVIHGSRRYLVVITFELMSLCFVPRNEFHLCGDGQNELLPYFLQTEETMIFLGSSVTYLKIIISNSVTYLIIIS